MRYWIILLTSLLISAFMVLVAPSDSQEQLLTSTEQTRILNEFSARLGKIKSLQAEFVQERHLQAFLDVLQTKGTIQFVAPDKLRWEVRDPYRSISILNGTKAAKFDVENGKILQMTGMQDFLYEVLHQIAVIIQGNFEGIGKTFQIKIQRKEQQYVLHLHPKDRDLGKNISGMQIVSDADLKRIEQVKIFEPQGDRIEITFSEPSVGLSFDSRLFDINQPILSK